MGFHRTFLLPQTHTHPSSIKEQLTSSAGKAPKRWLCRPLPGWPRAAVPQGWWAAPHTSQALWLHPHTAPLPHLRRSPFGLLHSMAQSITAAAEKKEKQTAGAAISLSHRSIINNSPFSARAFGPWIPRGWNRNIPRRCCPGHGRANTAHPNPAAVLCQVGAHPHAQCPPCEHSPAQWQPRSLEMPPSHHCQPSPRSSALLSEAELEKDGTMNTEAVQGNTEAVFYVLRVCNFFFFFLVLFLIKAEQKTQTEAFICFVQVNQFRPLQ